MIRVVPVFDEEVLRRKKVEASELLENSEKMFPFLHENPSSLMG